MAGPAMEERADDRRRHVELRVVPQHLGFGRIVVSELNLDVPYNMLVNLVASE